MPDRYAHPLAHTRAKLPCPRREGTRARPTDPLRLRADVPDDVATSSTSIESASTTRGMAGTTEESLCGKHTETSQRTEQIRLAQAKTKIKLRIWGQNAPFFSSMVSIESMVDAARRVVHCHRL